MSDHEQNDPFGRGGRQEDPFGRSSEPMSGGTEASWGPPAGQMHEVRISQSAPGKAMAALVLGIAGIFVCPVICSVLAVVFGRQAKQEIDRNPGMQGRGQAQAGFVLGIAGLVIAALFLLLIVIGVMAGDTTSAATLR